MIERQAFEEAVARLQAQVEARRRRHLRLFYINSVLACVLVVAVFCCSGTILGSIAHAIGRTSPISTLEYFSFYFFTTLCAASLVLLPVLRYQGSVKPEFALHRLVWQRLCDAMGNVELMPRGAEYQHQLQACGSFGAFAGVAERAGIKGRAGEYQFWMQEVAINSSEGDMPFCGIAVFGRSDHRLHGDDVQRHYQAGIADHDMILQAEAAPFQRFAALTGRAPVGRQKLYWDHKLLHQLQVLRERGEEWFINRHTKPALAAELDYEAQFLPAPDLLEAFRGAQESGQYPAFYLSLQGNDYVATLRCASPLFLNFSLFEPSFPTDKAVFAYELVCAISEIAGKNASRTPV